MCIIYFIYTRTYTYMYIHIHDIPMFSCVCVSVSLPQGPMPLPELIYMIHPMDPASSYEVCVLCMWKIAAIYRSLYRCVYLFAKLIIIAMEKHHFYFNYKWSCSIAMSNYWRVQVPLEQNPRRPTLESVAFCFSCENCPLSKATQRLCLTDTIWCSS